VVETVKGLSNLATNPTELVHLARAARKDPIGTAKALYHGYADPIADGINRGEYGEVSGRLSFEALSIAFGPKGTEKAFSALGNGVRRLVRPAEELAEASSAERALAPLAKQREAIGEVAANGGERLSWTSWENYPKVTQGGREYAQIGDRLYTRHAVDRLQPSGLGAPAGATGAGRSISPNFVEDVLSSTKGVPVKGPNGEARLSFTSGTVQVITESNIVITVITR
jgi:hypothetical protein